MKEVYHSAEEFLGLRRLVSGYEDVVRAGVRLKNQRYSLLRACGKAGYEKGKNKNVGNVEQRVMEGIERQIVCNGKEKTGYEEEFKSLAKKHAAIRYQMSLPGIGLMGAVKIVARVVSPQRFATAGHFLSYSGLVKLERKSGGVVYGRKNSRFSRDLKTVYKTGAVTAIEGNNFLQDYYDVLIKEKGYPDYQARHKVARRLATLSLGIFKSGRSYQPKLRDQEIKNPGL